MSTVRYSIGIDLGTTNCVMSFVDLKQANLGAQIVSIAQWDSAGVVLNSPTLPSFAYKPTAAQLPHYTSPDNQVSTPLNGWIPGIFARNQMALNPERVIHSAKSWLCHQGIDRMEAILPWQSADIDHGNKISPVQASAIYLGWLKDVWNRTMVANNPDATFNEQEIIITVPASFDDAAQELTLVAAEQANYPKNVRLIEEPQAAFYFWLGKDQHLSQLHGLLQTNNTHNLHILVCDIGGGTTDLSLFEARSDKQSSTGLTLKRLAVSNHLLLGGDNIDLKLAELIEQKLTSGKKKLTGRQWNQLLVQARELKERVLGGEESTSAGDLDHQFSITLTGSGAGLFSSTRTTKISGAEIHSCILDNFFPLCNCDATAQKTAANTKNWGLPYATDSAISHHLAAFINGQPVDAVLFNGGSVTPLLLRNRLHQLLCNWQPQHHPVVLNNDAISMAVARGAARYGWILNQTTTENRISGGHAHALYLAVVSGKKKRDKSVVCILPQGVEAGTTVQIDQTEFDLIVNQAARFQCCYSVQRKQDRAGDIIDWNSQDFQPLPPLETAIHLEHGRTVANNRLRVKLEATLNELGLLQLYCVAIDGKEQWRLDFNLRKGVEQDQATITAPEQETTNRNEVSPLLHQVFGKKKDPQLAEIAPKQLIQQLERKLGARASWDALTLRGLWPELAAGMTRKSRSVEHETAWLYLAGFTLRPGYGVQLDESRIEELWRLFNLGMSFPKEKRVQSHWYLLWRRIAGGLSSARQQQLLAKISPILRSGNAAVTEIIYLAGALERIAPSEKVELVHLLSTMLLKQRQHHTAPYIWALGRLLSRAPLYADASTIVHPREVMLLFDKVKQLDWGNEQWKGLSNLFSLAARYTEQRDIDLDPNMRGTIADKMRTSKATNANIHQIETFVPIDHNDREIQFGEALPAGLILINR